MYRVSNYLCSVNKNVKEKKKKKKLVSGTLFVNDVFIYLLSDDH